MKQPLYALLIAPIEEMIMAVIDGTKTITIREGHRDYRPGLPVMLCCHLESWAVMADIENVRHCVLNEVTREEWADDGFTSQEDLLTGLQRFYPNMTMDSPVTIIRWKNVRGFLVDAFKEDRDESYGPPAQ